jgi:hypothetical protein
MKDHEKPRDSTFCIRSVVIVQVWIYDLPTITQHSEDPHITRHCALARDTSLGLAGEYLTDVRSMVCNIQVSAEDSTIIWEYLVTSGV